VTNSTPVTGWRANNFKQGGKIVFHRKSLLLLNVVVVVGLLLAACAPAVTPAAPAATQPPQVVEVTKVVEQQVVATPTAAPPPPADTTKRLRFSTGIPGDIPTIDPALAEAVVSIQIIEENTVGLTRQEAATGAINPGMATDWKVSDDGLTYTFNLRTDVPWVKWDGDQVVKIQTCPDADGKTQDRMVTAKDFEYGILRTLDPKTASGYAYVLGMAIDNADLYNSGEITDTAQVGVKAIDDKTLEIKFKEPAVYNANIAGMWVAHAQPGWLIDGDDCTEARGDRWTETGFNQGYGPFTVKEWIHDSFITMVKNPFWPGIPSVPQPTIDEINWVMLDTSPTFSEFEAGNLDSAGIPLSEMDRVKTDSAYKDLIENIATLGTEFYAFNTKVAPTDDVRVRQALSLAIDRQSLVDDVNKGSGEVAQWFCRPGATGCPTPDKFPDLGVKYDPVKAKELLDAYLKEKGLTADQLNITLMFNTSESHKTRAEAIQQMWKENLGINVGLANQEWKVYLQQRSAPDAKENIFRGSWVQDYPDANNFLKEVFSKGGAYAEVVKWQSDAYDQLVADAAKETDPAKRTQLYADADKMLVADEAVIAPLYWYASPSIYQKNIVHPPSITGYDYYEFWDKQ
jgi:oligopeptide transport system substrate-binding protein